MTVLNATADAELGAAVGAAGGGWRSSSSECASFSSARARVCRLKLCDIKVWTLAAASWIQICEFEVNKIIVTRHTSECRLYMFVAIISR